MTRIYEGGRSVPPGIILEDYVDDVELGMLKRGKEAEVYLIERVGRDRSCLLAEKRYFAFEERTFKHNAGYRAHQRAQGWARDDGRIAKRKGGGGTQRAIDRGTDYGKRTLYGTWKATEWSMLTALWSAGAPVPYPVAQTGDGMLMEYIGDREMAAPRLAQAGVSKGELPALFGAFRAGVLAFARSGVVHGDLSPYNLLVWDGTVWFIDLPQAVPYLQNPNATDYLYRDLTNVCDWFARRGLDVDVEELFAEAVTELFEFKMTDLFVARE